MQTSLQIDLSLNIHNLIDMPKATMVRQGKKVRITLDVAESLVEEIDDIRKRIGIDRRALIKVWLSSLRGPSPHWGQRTLDH